MPTMECRQISKNNNCFDAIRYLLAILIIVAHYCVLSDTHLTGDFNLIENRVSIFFIISGFFSYMMYCKTPNPWHFAYKRLKRLVPAYWLTILLSVLLLSFISSEDVEGFWTNRQVYKYLSANLTFANFIEPALPGVFENNKMSAVNGSLWTMKVEIMFYVSVPIVYWLINRFGKNRVLIVIVALSILYDIGTAELYNHTGNPIYARLNHQVFGMFAYFYTPVLLLFNREKISRYALLLLVLCIPMLQ